MKKLLYFVFTSFQYDLSAIYDQPLSGNHYLLHRLNTPRKTDVLLAMELLQRRLTLMESDDYYLHIPVTELPIPIGIKAVMQERRMLTVKDLLLVEPEQLFVLRGVGEKNLALLKKLVATIEQRKETLKGLTDEELKAALL